MKKAGLFTVFRPCTVRFSGIRNPTVRPGAVLRKRKSFSAVRCGFQILEILRCDVVLWYTRRCGSVCVCVCVCFFFEKFKMLRCGSVRFWKIRNPTVWFGAVIYPTVLFSAVFRYRKSYGAVRCCDVSYGAVRRSSPLDAFYREIAKNRYTCSHLAKKR